MLRLLSPSASRPTPQCCSRWHLHCTIARQSPCSPQQQQQQHQCNVQIQAVTRHVAHNYTNTTIDLVFVNDSEQSMRRGLHKRHASCAKCTPKHPEAECTDPSGPDADKLFPNTFQNIMRCLLSDTWPLPPPATTVLLPRSCSSRLLLLVCFILHITFLKLDQFGCGKSRQLNELRNPASLSPTLSESTTQFNTVRCSNSIFLPTPER
jgi:hypothetical protein